MTSSSVVTLYILSLLPKLIIVVLAIGLYEITVISNSRNTDALFRRFSIPE